MINSKAYTPNKFSEVAPLKQPNCIIAATPVSNSLNQQHQYKPSTPVFRSTFAKRHPLVMERGELPSFIIEGPTQKLAQQKTKIKPPPYYFEPERIAPPLVPVTSFDGRTSKESERLFNKKAETLKKRKNSYSTEDLSTSFHHDEGLIAAQDYRIANAGGMNGQAQVKILNTLSKAGIQKQFVTNASLKLSKSSSRSYSDISTNSIEHTNDTRKNGIKLQSTKPNTANGHMLQKSMKKHPAPPPPPPPPVPISTYKGIT